MELRTTLLITAALLLLLSACGRPEDHPVFSSAQATEGAVPLYPSISPDAEEDRVYNYE